MPQKDTSGIKEKIVSTIKNNGPSLPARISRETGMSMLFASAFLSELLSEKRLKITNMKVGSSPVYYLPGQEEQLEPYSKYLKEKEKEAFLLLQENKFLKDNEQEPAIRVALRSIKDFAKYFTSEEGFGYWRYFLIPEQEFYNKKEKKEPENSKQEEKESSVPREQIKQETKTSEEKQDQTQEKTASKHNIFEPNEKKKSSESSSQKSSKSTKKKTSKNTHKKNERFFNKVKDYLKNKEIEISDIIGFDNKELILKINEEGKEKLLVAHNKKRIDEKDLTKANKKASEHKLEYVIFCLGEPLKRLNNLIEAVNNLNRIEKIE